jgi:putative membrane protein
MSTLFAFLHHLAAFTLVSAIAVEFVLLREKLTLGSARRLLATDAVVGVSATLVLVVGLLRVFYFEKGAAYYFESPAFLTKLTVFVAVAVLSTVPTLEFLSWRAAVHAGQMPQPSAKKIEILRSVLRIELAGVVVIVLCAAIMARGGWI